MIVLEEAPVAMQAASDDNAVCHSFMLCHGASVCGLENIDRHEKRVEDVVDGVCQVCGKPECLACAEAEYALLNAVSLYGFAVCPRCGHDIAPIK